MRARVLKEFRDISEGVTREVGDVFDVTESRLKEINGAGYGDLVEKVAAKRPAKKED